MPRDRDDGADRQVARFEDGELWSDHEASPPENPAGWYFRPRGGTSAPWIGPFPTADAARGASFRGDPAAAARRRLQDWTRAAAPSRPRAAAPAPAPVPPAPARVPAPPPPEPAAEPPRQLSLGLGPGEGPAAPAETPPRRPRARRRGDPAPPGAQEELPV